MLQQTQVLRVIPKYAEFIEAWPDVDTLARASTADVIRVWKGMGYNRRALYLRNTAREIVEKYHGEFPIEAKELVSLPGIGTYTARAILAFAYGVRVALVDTNIRRIITHFFFRDVPQKPSVIEGTAQKLLPVDKAWEWHQALMDYGALQLRDVKVKRPERSRRTTNVFRNSNRFYRGRIIDRLRAGKLRQKELISDMIKQYGKPEGFYLTLLEKLKVEGLITRSSRGIVSLPK
jgi:A/G-specific adenine glycosylase